MTAMARIEVNSYNLPAMTVGSVHDGEGTGE